MRINLSFPIVHMLFVFPVPRMLPVSLFLTMKRMFLRCVSMHYTIFLFVIIIKLMSTVRSETRNMAARGHVCLTHTVTSNNRTAFTILVTKVDVDEKSDVYLSGDMENVVESGLNEESGITK